MQKFIITVVPRQGLHYRRYLVVYALDMLDALSKAFNKYREFRLSDVLAIDLYDQRVHDYLLDEDKSISEDLRKSEVV